MSGELQAHSGHAMQGTTPADLLRHALDKGADMEQLGKLLDLQERWERNEARKAYTEAMTAFKATAPTILKTKHVRFKTDKGITEYWHADLAEAAAIISAELAKYGFSHSWKPKQEGESITVTCVITHHMGHSEAVSLTASPDKSGGKNSIQAVVSTVTYLERHTLLAATGLAAKDQDKDGQLPANYERISEQQKSQLLDMINATETPMARFLKVAQVDSLEDVRATEFENLMDGLRRKQKRQQEVAK